MIPDGETHRAFVHVRPDRGVEAELRPDLPVGEADLAADGPFVPLSADAYDLCRNRIGRGEIEGREDGGRRR